MYYCAAKFFNRNIFDYIYLKIFEELRIKRGKKNKQQICKIDVTESIDFFLEMFHKSSFSHSLFLNNIISSLIFTSFIILHFVVVF